MTDPKVNTTSMLPACVQSSGHQKVFGAAAMITSIALMVLGTVSLTKYPLFGHYNTAVSSSSIGGGGMLFLSGGFLMYKGFSLSHGSSAKQQQSTNNKRFKGGSQPTPEEQSCYFQSYKQLSYWVNIERKNPEVGDFKNKPLGLTSTDGNKYDFLRRQGSRGMHIHLVYEERGYRYEMQVANPSTGDFVTYPYLQKVSGAKTWNLIDMHFSKRSIDINEVIKIGIGNPVGCEPLSAL